MAIRATPSPPPPAQVAFKLPFDHVRKRMTVVLRLPDGEALALCKGADTSIAECLREEDRGCLSGCEFCAHFAVGCGIMPDLRPGFCRGSPGVCAIGRQGKTPNPRGWCCWGWGVSEITPASRRLGPKRDLFEVIVSIY